MVCQHLIAAFYQRNNGSQCVDETSPTHVLLFVEKIFAYVHDIYYDTGIEKIL